VLQVWGSADFVFNISYVCYRCGDRQIFKNSVLKQQYNIFSSLHDTLQHSTLLSTHSPLLIYITIIYYIILILLDKISLFILINVYK